MAVSIRSTNLHNISSPVVAGDSRWPLPLTELGGFETYTDMDIPNDESKSRGFIGIDDGSLMGVSRRLLVDDSVVDTVVFKPGWISQQNGAALFIYGDEAVYIITTSATTTLTIPPAPEYPIISQTLAYNNTTGMYSFVVGPHSNYNTDTGAVDNSALLGSLEAGKTINCTKINNAGGWDIYKMSIIPIDPSSFVFDVITPTTYHTNFFNGLIYIDESENTGDSFTATADTAILISYMPENYTLDTTSYIYTPSTQRPVMGSLTIRG